MASVAVHHDRTIGRRSAPRTVCNLMVEVKGGAHPWGRAMLADLSTTGFRVVGVRQPADGGSLWLRASGMEPLPAKIRWSSGTTIGCQFLYPLDRATEDSLRALLADGRQGELIGAVA